jgi:hypothetical protein
MKKHSKEELQNMGLPEPTRMNIEWFGLGGKSATEERTAFAKRVCCVYDYDNVSKQFFLRISSGELIDPYYTNAGIGKARLATFAFKKVDSNTFDAFVKYLKSKKRTDYTFARRLLMETK